MSSPADALVTTLEHVAYPMNESLEAELRASVHAFVDARRGAGTPPERLIVELKELSRAALRRRGLTSAIQESDNSRLLLEQMVRWAIAYYYER